MKKFTEKEIMICKFTSDFIEKLVSEFKLTDEKKIRLTQMAVEDLSKLFNYEKNI